MGTCTCLSFSSELQQQLDRAVQPTKFLKNKWMEFLFSSFLGTLAASSPLWDVPETDLLSVVASGDLAAAFGSSLAFAVGTDSAAAAGGAGVSFLGSAA